MNFVTEKQRQAEKSIENLLSQCYKGEMTEEETNEEIDKIVHSGVFSEEDIENLDFRRDPEKQRSYTNFFKNIMKSHEKEKKVFLSFVEHLKSKGHLVKWEPFGTDEVGKVIIASFNEIVRNPSAPDYKISVDNNSYKPCEVKSFSHYQRLKVKDLERYIKYVSHLVVGMSGFLVWYPPKTLKHLLMIPRKGFEIGGKECIKINKEGGDCDITLKKLKDKNMIRIIKIKDTKTEENKKKKSQTFKRQVESINIFADTEKN